MMSETIYFIGATDAPYTCNVVFPLFIHFGRFPVLRSIQY